MSQRITEVEKCALAVRIVNSVITLQPFQIIICIFSQMYFLTMLTRWVFSRAAVNCIIHRQAVTEIWQQTSALGLWRICSVSWQNTLLDNLLPFFFPACRTYLIATRFWVVVICPIIKCLTVLEFSFILFNLCLFITIFNFILNYVPIVTFWIFTYHKIWILLIIFCFIWNYWIIYFLTCLEVFWSVVS